MKSEDDDAAGDSAQVPPAGADDLGDENADDENEASTAGDVAASLDECPDYRTTCAHADCRNECAAGVRDSGLPLFCRHHYSHNDNASLPTNAYNAMAVGFSRAAAVAFAQCSKEDETAGVDGQGALPQSPLFMFKDCPCCSEDCDKQAETGP